jgi:lipoyl(octanoyl) transferase
MPVRTFRAQQRNEYILVAMSPVLRLIDDTQHGAAFNMAADLHLISQCEKTPAVFVRLYSWEKPSITLGLTEKPGATLDFDAIKANGVEWIRRPTGGRSVLHDHDVTYSCVFSTGIKEMGATLMETYGVISGCLMNGLRKSGIACEAHDSPLDSSLSRMSLRLPCFLSPNRHEIMVCGRKLLGSAQKRTAKAVLQHGSIPLTPAFRSLPDYLALPASEREAQKHLLGNKTACVSELLPTFDSQAIRQFLIEGFKDTLQLSFAASRWSAREMKEITGMSKNPEFLSKWQSLDDQKRA